MEPGISAYLLSRVNRLRTRWQRIAYYYTVPATPTKTPTNWGLAGKFQNCFAITRAPLPYDGTQPIADVSRLGHPHQCQPHGAGIGLGNGQYLAGTGLCPGTLVDCGCSGQGSNGKMIEMDEQPTTIWEHSAPLECCPEQVPESRFLHTNTHIATKQNKRGAQGGFNRSEAEEKHLTVAEPWPQFTESTDCHPDVVPFPTDTLPVNPCIEYLLQTAATAAQFDYAAYLAQKREEYKQMYREHCMQLTETFDVGYKTAQYHYTLYYHDRAGNLVKTVPPHAVVPLTGTAAASVNGARAANTVVVPVHTARNRRPL